MHGRKRAMNTHVMPHQRVVDDGSEIHGPPCNRCSFYQGGAKCAFYTNQVPKAFLAGDQICGRYMRRVHGDAET
ncbi:MAG: hypothetical protein ACXV3D_03600 [Halobacteriota archaeon]